MLEHHGRLFQVYLNAFVCLLLPFDIDSDGPHLEVSESPTTLAAADTQASQMMSGFCKSICSLRVQAEIGSVGSPMSCHGPVVGLCPYSEIRSADVLMQMCITACQVREALATKVSRERFGAEISGCFKGARFAVVCCRRSKAPPSLYCRT